MTDDEPITTVSYENGQRIVRYEVQTEDGPVVLQHSLPDSLSHHYVPSGVNEDVPLFEGNFRVGGNPETYNGDIRWRWGAIPRIEYRGTRSAREVDPAFFTEDSSANQWVSTPQVQVDLVEDAIPPQPIELSQVENLGYYVTDRVEQQLGSEEHLDEVRFLVPNGWEALDAAGLCDPSERQSMWRGRTVITSGDWRITLDRHRSMQAVAWRELKDTYGQQFTHIGMLKRIDNSGFDGETAFHVLDRVRLGLCLALGRRITCALPVGYRDGVATWARWRSSLVDPYRSASHLLDQTIASEQIRSIVGLTLDATEDPAALGAVSAAVSYYMSANNGVTVDLTVPLPVSGLQLMAYYRFVSSDQATHSRSKWKTDMDSTEKELRHLLDDCSIDTAMPGHFQHLIGARQCLSADKQAGDALTTIVAMRNVVTHPTRDLPFEKFNLYMWAEAGMVARYWLCMAILRQIGYQGQVAAVLSERPRWPGAVRSVPWD